MRRMFGIIALVVAVSTVVLLMKTETNAQQQREPSPSTSMRPLRPVHTFSIVARDPVTGELGVAVQSHWFSVGSVVPWAEAGVGAVATQSFVDPSYGKLGLDLLRAGKSAPDALRALLGGDASCEVRQVGMVDPSGAVATFTGSRDIVAAGGIASQSTQSVKIDCGAAGGTLIVGREF